MNTVAGWGTIDLTGHHFIVVNGSVIIASLMAASRMLHVLWLVVVHRMGVSSVLERRVHASWGGVVLFRRWVLKFVYIAVLKTLKH